MYINEIDVKNKVYNYYFYNLIKAKNIKTKNILISKENYKDLKIYFTRYVYQKVEKNLKSALPWINAKDWRT